MEIVHIVKKKLRLGANDEKMCLRALSLPEGVDLVRCLGISFVFVFTDYGRVRSKLVQAREAYGLESHTH